MLYFCYKPDCVAVYLKTTVPMEPYLKQFFDTNIYRRKKFRQMVRLVYMHILQMHYETSLKHEKAVLARSKHYIEIYYPAKPNNDEVVERVELGEEMINHILDVLYEDFDTELVAYIDMAYHFGIQKKDAVINFLKKNGITEDECSFEMLKKRYQRHKNRVDIGFD